MITKYIWFFFRSVYLCVVEWPLNFFYLKLTVNQLDSLVRIIRQESYCHSTRMYLMIWRWFVSCLFVGWLVCCLYVPLSLSLCLCVCVYFVRTRRMKEKYISCDSRWKSCIDLNCCLCIRTTIQLKSQISKSYTILTKLG